MTMRRCPTDVGKFVEAGTGTPMPAPEVVAAVASTSMLTAALQLTVIFAIGGMTKGAAVVALVRLAPLTTMAPSQRFSPALGAVTARQAASAARRVRVCMGCPSLRVKVPWAHAQD